MAHGHFDYLGGHMLKRVVSGLITLTCFTMTVSSAHATLLRVYMDWYPNIEFAGLYAAQEKGWYKAAGIDLELVFEGLDIIPNVLKGKADIGMHSGHDIIRHVGAGENIKAFAAQYQLNPNSIVVGQDSGISSVKELKGKTLGVFAPQDRDMYRVMLGYHGLTLDDVKFKEIKTFKEAEIIEILKSKQVDAIIAWEFNWTVTFALLGYQVRVFPGYENGFHFYGTVFFAKPEFIKSQRALLTKFIEVTFKGWKEVYRNPEYAVRQVIEKRYSPERYINGSKELTYQQQLSELKLRRRYFIEGVGEEKMGHMTQFQWNRGLAIAKQYGLIDSKSKLQSKDVFDDSVLRKVRSSP